MRSPESNAGSPPTSRRATSVESSEGASPDNEVAAKSELGNAGRALNFLSASILFFEVIGYLRKFYHSVTRKKHRHEPLFDRPTSHGISMSSPTPRLGLLLSRAPRSRGGELCYFQQTARRNVEGIGNPTESDNADVDLLFRDVINEAGDALGASPYRSDKSK